MFFEEHFTNLIVSNLIYVYTLHEIRIKRNSSNGRIVTSFQDNTNGFWGSFYYQGTYVFPDAKSVLGEACTPAVSRRNSQEQN